MSINKKTGVAFGVLVSALCVPLVCLVSYLMCSNRHPAEKNRRADRRAKRNFEAPMCAVADLKKSYGVAFVLGVCVIPTGKCGSPPVWIPIHIFSSNYFDFGISS